MTVEAGLYAHLVGHPGVNQIAGTRVYPLKIPQNAAMPALAYRRVSNVSEQSHQGSSGLAHPRFQLDGLARRYADAVALREAVRLALEGFKGLLGTFPVQAVLWDGDWDDYDEDLELYRVTMDVRIWHAENQP